MDVGGYIDIKQHIHEYTISYLTPIKILHCTGNKIFSLSFVSLGCLSQIDVSGVLVSQLWKRKKISFVIFANLLAVNIPTLPGFKLST